MHVCVMIIIDLYLSLYDIFTFNMCFTLDWIFLSNEVQYALMLVPYQPAIAKVCHSESREVNVT